MVSSDYGHSAGLPGSMYYAKISGVLLLLFFLLVYLATGNCHCRLSLVSRYPLTEDCLFKVITVSVSGSQFISLSFYTYSNHNS